MDSPAESMVFVLIVLAASSVCASPDTEARAARRTSTNAHPIRAETAELACKMF